MSGLVTFDKGVEFKDTFKFLEAIRDRRISSILDEYGRKGVDLLREATPKRTGTTANSWDYRVVMEPGHVGLEWINTNKGNDGQTPVAVLIQFGHGTRNGGWVAPVDYINPVMNPLFDELVEEISKVVTTL